jgi:hypothetical protein
VEQDGTVNFKPGTMMKLSGDVFVLPYSRDALDVHAALEFTRQATARDWVRLGNEDIITVLATFNTIERVTGFTFLTALSSTHGVIIVSFTALRDGRFSVIS